MQIDLYVQGKFIFFHILTHNMQIKSDVILYFLKTDPEDHVVGTKSKPLCRNIEPRSHKESTYDSHNFILKQ